MPAYWLARAKIVDQAEYGEFTDRLSEVMARYGGRILSRGAPYGTSGGPDRFVLIEVDAVADVKRCFGSSDDRAVAGFRRHGAGGNELTVGGGEHPA